MRFIFGALLSGLFIGCFTKPADTTPADTVIAEDIPVEDTSVEDTSVEDTSASDSSLPPDTASDAVDSTATDAENQPPTLEAFTEQGLDEGVAFELVPVAVDPDGDILNFRAENLPTGAAVHPQTGRFTWTPSYEQAGTYTCTVIVSDGVLDASQPLSLEVREALVNEGLVAWWTLDALDNGVLEDRTGAGHDAALESAALVGDAFLGNAVQLDGVSGYAHVDGGGGGVGAVEGVTVMAWVNSDVATVNGARRDIVSRWRRRGAGFTEGASWTSFDAGDAGVGIDPDGYVGSAFDGRYVYFAPNNNDNNQLARQHGEVLRYDTTQDLNVVTAWTTFDPGAASLGVDPDGYIGATFDGRYVYFTPNHNGTAYHGEMLRYDTTLDFMSVGSWTVFDPGAEGVGTRTGGYRGTVFDGRYLYLVPGRDDTSEHAEVLRYDTTLDFVATASWKAFEPAGSAKGLWGGTFDGRYIYFSPRYDGAAWSSEVLRYDTTQGFDTASSWKTFDPVAAGMNGSPQGFYGALFDGRYVYFVPSTNSVLGVHGVVLRYDTTESFDALASWQAFDPGDAGVGIDPDGYVDATFDGRFLYFAPGFNGTAPHGEVLRLDTTLDFAALSSWSTYTASVLGTSSPLFAGRYVYFSPGSNSAGNHGEVLRFDAKEGDLGYRLGFSESGQGSFGNAPFGPTAEIVTDEGHFAAYSHQQLEAGTWYHIAMVYEGATLKLYIDGVEAASTAATGSLQDTTAPLVLGGMAEGRAFFSGKLDEVQLYHRGLSPQEVVHNFCATSAWAERQPDNCP